MMLTFCGNATICFVDAEAVCTVCFWVSGSNLNVKTLIELICQMEVTKNASVKSAEIFLCSLNKYCIFILNSDQLAEGYKAG